MKLTGLCVALLSFSLLSAASQAASPQAPARTNAQNYKDMVLASCMAQAYQRDPDAAADAGSSIAALREWTEYELERSPDAVKVLVDSYFLKCMDLYHSKALDDLAKRLVLHPKRTAR